MSDRDWSRNYNRRSVLQSTGITAASIIGLSGSVVGKSRDNNSDSPTASEIGIHERIKQLCKDKKFKKAKSLLEEHNIKHSGSIKYPSGQEPLDSNSSDPISPQDFFEESNSYVTPYMWTVETDLIGVQMSWNCTSESADADGPAPEDKLNIAWHPQVFAGVSGSMELTVEAENEEATSLLSDVVDDPLGGETGLTEISIHDRKANSMLTSNTVGGYFYQEVNKHRDDAEGQIKAEYVHTWSPFNSSDISGVGVSRDLLSGYSVDISIKLPDLTDSWELGDQEWY